LGSRGNCPEVRWLRPPARPRNKSRAPCLIHLLDPQVSYVPLARDPHRCTRPVHLYAAHSIRHTHPSAVFTTHLRRGAPPRRHHRGAPTSHATPHRFPCARSRRTARRRPRHSSAGAALRAPLPRRRRRSLRQREPARPGSPQPAQLVRDAAGQSIHGRAFVRRRVAAARRDEAPCAASRACSFVFRCLTQIPAIGQAPSGPSFEPIQWCNTQGPGARPVAPTRLRQPAGTVLIPGGQQSGGERRL